MTDAMRLLLDWGRRFDEEELQAGAGRRTAEMFLASRLLHVRDRTGGLAPLRANRAQQSFEARRGRLNIVLKARQMGLTTWVAGRFFLKTVTHPGVLTVQVAHTREAAEAIFQMVERMWRNLPERLQAEPLKRSHATSGRMVFPELDSEYRVVSAGEENAGRGMTIQNLHLSELSRWPGDARVTLAGLRAALAPGGEMTIESTPNGASGAFYEEWCASAEASAGGLTQASSVRHFMPWWMERGYRGVAVPADSQTLEEAGLVARHGLDDEQIGYRRGLVQGFRGLRAQEFAEDAESCFLASGDCVFEVGAIEQRLLEIGAELTPESRRGGALLVWLPAVRNRVYLLGVDTCGGGSEGDFAAIQVIERETGLQCAELRERLAPLELARVAAALAREYGGATIAVERNNHGTAVLAYLDAVEGYAQVYGQLGKAGWLTSAGSKPGMIGRMGALLETDARLFFSERLLRECRSFVNGPNGRQSAASGAQDDCLMAMAVAHAVRAEKAGKA